MEQKSKMVAGLLGIFLGWLGIHNFYLGNTKKAIIQVCLGGIGLLTSWLFIGIFLILGAEIWGIVEGIFILTGKEGYDTDADGTPLAD
jgi:TM2 domain-containing membrane protein YozV